MFFKTNGEASPGQLKLSSRKQNDDTKLNMSFALLPGAAIQFILGQITAMVTVELLVQFIKMTLVEVIPREQNVTVR